MIILFDLQKHFVKSHDLYKAQTFLKARIGKQVLVRGLLFLDLCLLNGMVGVVFVLCIHCGYT